MVNRELFLFTRKRSNFPLSNRENIPFLHILHISTGLCVQIPALQLLLFVFKQNRYIYIFYALFLKLHYRYLRKKSCSHDQVSLLKKDRKDGRSALRSCLPRWRFPLHHVGIGGYFTSWRAPLSMASLGNCPPTPPLSQH